MASLDQVLADVAEEKSQIESLSTLTSGIKKQLDDILVGQLPPEVQAKVDNLFAGVEANKQAVVDAINKNTTPPAGSEGEEPEPPPPPGSTEGPGK